MNLPRNPDQTEPPVDATNMKQVIYCQCHSGELLSDELRTEIEQGLERLPARTVIVDDICHLAARGDGRLDGWAQANAIIATACTRRALLWLFARAGAELDEAFRHVTLCDRTAADILAEIASLLPADPGPGRCERIAASDDWPAWFPVIDYARCTDCQACLNFCLFGVYRGESSGEVTVAHPDACKTNCPACARVCPAGAIIFPKHPDAPVNGGEPDPAGPAQLDLAQLVRGDVMAALRNRTDPHACPAPAETLACACDSAPEALLAKLGLDAAAIRDISETVARAQEPPAPAEPTGCGCDCGCTSDNPDDSCACGPDGECGCQSDDAEPPRGCGCSDGKCHP